MESINSVKLARKSVPIGTSCLKVPLYIGSDRDALCALLDYACKALNREEKRAERRARSGLIINHSDLFHAREFARGVFDMLSTEFARARDGDA